ncbi:MAG: glycogen/starch synthase [Bacteroidetes bacterium]|jgi:starch synthase|nr:glycogen/starch synthase [Bacteroidota bacterium]MBT5531215.1 glycogen/starch synthase [Cytophagia bacterium]MBT3423236.1 glycogen/starch synthase [Bacteroidota bacterium]MBT3800219.1 glycogen/starch synthase [Bacteroidota bacterium]MBT3934308.1 glycogen/starch synthase [Bacteroidota bacterium]
MTNQKILIVCHEMAPYTDLTEQAIFLRDLALNLQKRGAEIRVFMPKFGHIKERKHRLHEVIRLSGLNITVGRNNNPLIIKVASLQTAKIQVYFLDNEDFFQRKNFFHDDGDKFYEDNDERAIFYNKGVLELLVKLGWMPDVIHCQGWLSGLVPAYARTTFSSEPSLKKVKLISSIYHDGLKNNLGADFVKKSHLKLPDGDFGYLDDPKVSDLYKCGANFSDIVVFSSDQVDKETDDFVSTLKKPILDIRKNQGDSFYDKYFELIS